MLYNHFTKDEMDKIESILNQYSIIHAITIDQNLIDDQNERAKYIIDRHAQIRRTNTFYCVEIEKNEFDRLPEAGKKSLEEFNIFPDMTDIIFKSENETIEPFEAPVKKGIQYQLIGLLIFVALSFVVYEWVDTYIITVFEQDKPDIVIMGPEKMFSGHLIDKN